MVNVMEVYIRNVGGMTEGREGERECDQREMLPSPCHQIITQL